MRKGLEATRANSAVRACVCAIVFVCACLCVCGVRWLGGLFGIVWAVFNTSGVLKPPPVVPPFCPHSTTQFVEGVTEEDLAVIHLP